MKHVIFSKQCDHDLDLAPLWYHYYTHVYRADLIVLTPVKTALSEIRGVCEFYRARGIEVIPIEREEWDDEAIWHRQLDIIRPLIARLGDEFTAISADTDQFFQPLGNDLLGSDVVFSRHFVYADSTPTLEGLESFHASVERTYDLVGGFVNTLDNPRVGFTGHFCGLVPRLPIRRELHFAFRGSKQFREKLQRLAIKQDDRPEAQHWKSWTATLGDEKALGQLITEMSPDQHGSREGESILRSFCDLVLGRDEGKELRSPCPFGSQLLSNRFSVDTPSGPRSLRLLYPLADLDQMKELFSSGCYRLPEAIVPKRVIDIGAHIGVFCAIIKFQYPEASVVCFEPTPDTAGLLHSNFQADGNVRVIASAVSDVPGSGPWFIDLLTTMNDSLEGGQKRVLSSQSVVTVDARTLNLLYPDEQIDVLKIAANGRTAGIVSMLGDLLKRVRCLILTYRQDELRAEVSSLDSALRLARRTSISTGAVEMYLREG
ncbi:MAG: FkbM family methyltransferase [Bdellovibrionota bacterium]